MFISKKMDPCFSLAVRWAFLRFEAGKKAARQSLCNKGVPESENRKGGGLFEAKWRSGGIAVTMLFVWYKNFSAKNDLISMK